MAKKKALGKGLSALLEHSEKNQEAEGEVTGSSKMVGSIASIPLEEIKTNPFQPRTNFEQEALEELSNSIKEHGVIQPITVRKLGYNKFQIISGERRFRASQLAGLKEIPAYIRIANDQTMLEMALVENLQRENLDAIEVAISYQRLMDECDLTQDELSKKVAKKRSTVTNYLRLLKLPADIQIAIRDKKISMGHARAILGAESEALQLKLLKKIMKEGLSVRKTEELVKNAGKSKSKSGSQKVTLSFEQQKVKDDLEDFLGTKIQISKSKEGNGKLVINFASDSDLKRIIDLLDY